MAKKFRTFSADFETTVYKGQTATEVWAAASVELFTEDVQIFHSIGDLYQYYISLDCNVCAYFHNLKFDGSFWLSYLMVDLELKQALIKHNVQGTDVEFIDKKKMQNGTFSYCISDLGQWYSITIKTHNHIIEFRDSYKLLPFSVKRIGQSFKTKHKKLDMKYEGFRYAGCEITEKEKSILQMMY
jgi:DNA polymerase type B, organellar and viral.